MPNQPINSFEANFKNGFVTEFTGLNFPENAATNSSNVKYTIPGDVLRRSGITWEKNSTLQDIGSRLGNAVSTYVWNNAGGDGSTKILVTQNGGTLYFFNISSATVSSPLSNQKIAGSITLSTYVVPGQTVDTSVECQFADGNGYLFVYHADCSPFYVTYSSGTVTGAQINIQIRDFYGIFENVGTNVRPVTLSSEHSYNLQNQGWVAGNAWYATSSSGANIVVGSGATFTVQTGLSGVVNGQNVGVYLDTAVPGAGYGGGGIVMNGTVTSYTSATGVLVLDIYSVTDNPGLAGGFFSSWTLVPFNTGYINTWLTDEGNYPSNADVWWYFKNTSFNFDPTSTQPNVTLSIGNAPKGHFVLDPFNMDRTAISGVTGLTNVTTNKRPTTGCWFQGRVWYAGVGDSQAATGDATVYPWSTNIYFSQVCTNTPDNFGNCFQNNDPTSENLFDLLPTDGGIIQIPEAGLVKKLYPIANGLLVFAQNGIWFITGSTGIGFSANDYTIAKISSVEILSGHSFVDVQGLPYFWNIEGIYKVEASGHGIGGLSVVPITVNTIRSWYNSIPNISKVYARGAYNPIEYTIQWIYKTTSETSVTDRYSFDGVLNFNTYLKSFYPYVVSNTNPSINSISFIQPFETGTSVIPIFKYLSSDFTSKYLFAFADEHDTGYVDWGNVDFISTFTTGYNLAKSSFLKLYSGEGQKRLQVSYLFIYSRNTGYNSYYIRSLWDFANSSNSGRWSRNEFHENNFNNFDMVGRKYKPRGRGYAIQFQVTSVTGQPFDIIGWSAYEHVNVGV